MPTQKCLYCTVGYNNFDCFFDKMEPPRTEIDVQWDSSRTYLYNRFFVLCTVSSNFGSKVSKKSANKFFFVKFDMGTVKRKIQC